MTLADSDLQTPLVSIGVPIRNGGHFTRGALETLVSQTYGNIEIVISDNASDDETADVIADFSRADPRIRVFRQERLLSAAENFRFVFEQSRGEFFMWAACDDRRSLDYVEKLLAAMQANPGASLAFGDVAEITQVEDWRGVPPFFYPFESLRDDTVTRKLQRYTRINCLHVYGLLRRAALNDYEWPGIDNGPDIALLVRLALMGDFVRAEGGCFYYYIPAVPKSLEERAVTNSLRRLRKFPEVRLAWACARVAHRAGDMTGHPIPLVRAFLTVYLNRHWRWIKPWLFEMSPSFVVTFYRKWFKLNVAD